MLGINVGQILRLEVAVVVVLGDRQMSLKDVLALSPGSIIELPKNAEAELDLAVAGKPIGCGSAVKVGENFGIRLTYVGNLDYRLEASIDAVQGAEVGQSAEDLAAAMLAGQI
jgi:flagellar motor switch protein FliN/FliY